MRLGSPLPVGGATLTTNKRDASRAGWRPMSGPGSGPTPERHGSPPDDVLTAKRRAPRPSPHFVPRPGLFARLTEGTRGPLTLVCAPAGYGKTSLLVGWHASVPPPRPLLAWVSLDADDADPVRFGTHLLHALGGVHPGL